MTLLSLSRPYIPSFKLKSIPKSNPKPYSLSQPLASIFSLNPIASLSNHNNSINDNKSLSPALAAAWQPPKYVYPDPIPEFALVETEKFRGELRKKLLKSKETFGDDIDAVVEVCAELILLKDLYRSLNNGLFNYYELKEPWIFSKFLHEEYGGPGTLLVEPFTDMLLALKEKKLPGAPVAARAALLWAQNYVDKDWELWVTPQPSKLNNSGPS